MFIQTFLLGSDLLAPARTISRMVQVHLVRVIVLCSSIRRTVGVQLVCVVVHVALRGSTLRHLWFVIVNLNCFLLARNTTHKNY